MPLTTVTISGVLYHPNGALATDEPVTITKVVKAGSLITLLPKTVRSHATTGVVTLTLPASSTAYLYAKVNGLDTNRREGVALTIPSTDANLEDLIAVASIPSTGLTVKSNGIALASLIGTLNITGDGAVVTQTSAGVAELAFAAGAGGGSHNLLSATHPDSTAASPSRGDIITGQGATPKWSRLAKGASGTYLRSDGTDVGYSALLAGDLPSAIDAAKIGDGSVSNAEYQRLDGVNAAIVVTTDARLTDARTPTGSAGGVLSGTYPNPGFANDMALQSELDAEIAARIAAVATKQDTLGFTPENAATKNQAGGYAGLDGSSKLNPSHLPAIAISNYLGSVASQAAMLALTGERGDWAIRSDLNQTFIIIGDDPTQLADWQAIATPTDLVSSVFGRTGVVTAQANDYTWAQIDKTTSSLADIAIRSASDLSSGTLPDGRFPATLPALSGINLTALNASNLGSGAIPDARFPATLPAISGANLTGLTKSQVGLGNVDNIQQQPLSARLSEVATIGSALQQIRVNAGATALEYFTPSAGGGTPGGSDTHVQFNDGGAFGGDAGFTYNKTTDSITLAGVVTADKFKTAGPYLMASNINGNTIAVLAGDFNTYRRVVAAGFIIGPDDSSSADIQFTRIDASVAGITNPIGGGGVLEMSQVTSGGTPSTNSARIYVKDVAGNAEWFVKDEAGAETQISPHDPITGEWIFYSSNRKTGKCIRVNMDRAMRLLEQLSGERFIEEWEEAA